MTYTLEVYEQYCSNEILEFNTVVEALEYIRANELYVGNLSLYPTPVCINLYKALDPTCEG